GRSRRRRVNGGAPSLLRQPVAPSWTALLATGIFAFHPLQTEAVAYVFARATLLATLFCLLAWRDWLGGQRWRAVAWLALALLSKEECAAFPVFLWLVGLGGGGGGGRGRPPLLGVGWAAAGGGARPLPFRHPSQRGRGRRP